MYLYFFFCFLLHWQLNRNLSRITHQNSSLSASPATHKLGLSCRTIVVVVAKLIQFAWCSKVTSPRGLTDDATADVWLSDFQPVVIGAQIKTCNSSNLTIAKYLQMIVYKYVVVGEEEGNCWPVTHNNSKYSLDCGWNCAVWWLLNWFIEIARFSFVSHCRSSRWNSWRYRFNLHYLNMYGCFFLAISADELNALRKFSLLIPRTSWIMIKADAADNHRLLLHVDVWFCRYLVAYIVNWLATGANRSIQYSERRFRYG